MVSLYRMPGRDSHINALFIPMILAGGSSLPNWLSLSGQEDSPPLLPFHLAIVIRKPFLRIYSYGLWALALFIPCQAHVSAVRDKEGVAALILLQTE